MLCISEPRRATSAPAACVYFRSAQPAAGGRRETQACVYCPRPVKRVEPVDKSRCARAWSAVDRACLSISERGTGIPPVRLWRTAGMRLFRSRPRACVYFGRTPTWGMRRGSEPAGPRGMRLFRSRLNWTRACVYFGTGRLTGSCWPELPELHAGTGSILAEPVNPRCVYFGAGLNIRIMRPDRLFRSRLTRACVYSGAG